ncbi:MAG: hypothetical protein ACP5RJ_08705 [Conexivisphaera sp.]
MNQFESIVFFIILMNAAGAAVNAMGVFPYTIQTSSLVTVHTIQQGAGATVYGNGSATFNTPTLTGFGSSIYSYVLMFGDWFGAMVSFISTLAVSVLIPSFYLTQWGVPSAIANVINVAVWFDYFIFIMLHLRGNRE